MRLHTPILALLAATALTACSGGEKVETPEVKTDVEMVEKTVSLDAVLAHPRRAEDAKRDQFRNPKETLEFFEVGPGKRVGEIWPGWYTKATAPFLAANGGQYVAILYPEGVSDGLDKRIAAYKEAYADAEVYGEIDYAAFWGDDNPILSEGQAPLDVLVTYRNVHNWMGRGYAQDAFDKFYAALTSGYVQESYMKDLAKQAGFEFVASSEVNANPKDTADHPFGVWTLPPRSRLPKEGSVEAADFEAESYKNIGESDRATLKFRKPK